MLSMKNPVTQVLVVEDNPGDVRLVREVFDEAGFSNYLSVVVDGEQALDFLRKKGRFSQAPQPGLVILDIGLPGKSGLEVLREIKQDHNLRRIPVLILSSSNARADILKGYELYANAFITKPGSLDQFIQAVRIIENFWLEIASLPGQNEAGLI